MWIIYNAWSVSLPLIWQLANVCLRKKGRYGKSRSPSNKSKKVGVVNKWYLYNFWLKLMTIKFVFLLKKIPVYLTYKWLVTIFFLNSACNAMLMKDEKVWFQFLVGLHRGVEELTQIHKASKLKARTYTRSALCGLLSFYLVSLVPGLVTK